MPEADSSLKAEHGHLMVIGGAEDRERDKKILCKFIDLAGGLEKKIAVLTAATEFQEETWRAYDEAFANLGVRHRIPVHASSRDEANDTGLAQEAAAADGIFITGGDQKRLLSVVGGTELDAALHHAFKQRGACIAGTSAGASAMSGHMLALGPTSETPEKDSVHLAAGLGFLQRVVIDQHFSERRRLTRLLTVVAQNPYLFGIGIDEDTALVIERGVGIEVVGEGAVTVIDGRHMASNFFPSGTRERLELSNVLLHLLPAGIRYPCNAGGRREGDRDISQPLQDFLSIITKPTPLS